MFLVIRLKRFLCLFILFSILTTLLSIGAKCAFTDNAEEKIALPILMYHHILKDESKQGEYVISSSELECDLKFLKENGYTSITMSDLTAFVQHGTKLPEKPVMITFDDGYLSTLEYAQPLLIKYDMKAVVSVVAKYAEDYSKTPDRNISYAHLTWEDIAEMEKSKVFEIQNHSYDMHKIKSNKRKGTKRAPGESEAEYKKAFCEDVGYAQLLFREKCGFEPTCFTYPFGLISPESVEFVSDMGFSSSLSCYEGINYLSGKEEELHLLKRYNRAHGKSAEAILKK